MNLNFGHFAPPQINQMVNNTPLANGPMVRPMTQPCNLIYPVPGTPYYSSVPIQSSSQIVCPSIRPYIQQFPQQQYVSYRAVPVKPPPTDQNQYHPQFMPAKPADLKPIEKRASHALPIIDPNSKKDIIKELKNDQNNNNVEPDENENNNNEACCSKLRRSAPEFLPLHLSPPPCIPEPQNTNCIHDPEIQQNESQVDAGFINDTVENCSQEEELSFIDENPSITASIRQIPTNLEQQLNKHEEDAIPRNKLLNLSNNQASHTSLPDSYQSDLPRKHYSTQNFNAHSLPQYGPSYHHSQQNFHQQQRHQRNFGHGHKRMENYTHINDHRPAFSRHDKFNKHPGPFHNRNNNNNNYHHQNHHKQHFENFSYNGRQFGNNNSNNNNYETERWTNANNNCSTLKGGSGKIDQQCTAHVTKDTNENFVTSEADETKDLSDLIETDLNNNEESIKDMNSNEIKTEDMNSNEIKTEDLNVTAEESQVNSTTENSQNSLNTSIRYSQEKLAELKKSPLVLTKPPTHNDILDSSLKGFVWRILFDKNCREEYSYSNDIPNTSFSNKSLNGKKSNSRFDHNNHNHHQGQLMRSKSGGSDKHIIKMSLSLKEEVKLNEAENAWKPGHLKSQEDMSDEERELELLRKNFRSLLNKITEENFEHLIKEISDKQKFIINTPEKLAAIVELLFEKSISEPGYASTYAKLCHSLSTVHLFEVQNLNRKSKTKNPWKLNLISRCQEEFERTKTDDVRFKELQKQIKEATDAEEIENLEDIYFKLRQRANGTVKFIGELYKMDMLTASIMRKCIAGLITSVTEENIERLCKLFTTVGEKLEGQIKDTNDMDSYMKNLEKLKNSSVITTQRIKFDIMNVIDLRKSNWKQRENSRILETKPQKLQQLQEEEEKRKKKQQLQLNDFNERQQQHNNRSFQQNMGGRHNNNHNNKSQRMNDNEGFRTSSTRNFDFNKVKIPTKNEGSEMTLGPPRNLYQNFNKPTAVPSTKVSNPYANLPTDCDDSEALGLIHHTRSGSANKHSRNNHSHSNKSNGHNNNNHHHNHKTHNGPSIPAVREVPSKPRLPTPEPEKIKEEPMDDDDDDDYFMIEMTDREEKELKVLTEKMQQVFKGKLTMDMLLTDIKKISITQNILGMVYTELFDKKTAERKELLEIVGEIFARGFISTVVNIEGLKLSLKSIPSIICDVPLAKEYFAEYCVYFIENGQLKIENAEIICQNQQNILEIIKQKSAPISNEDISENMSAVSLPITPVKPKIVRSLKNLMESVHFKLKKKLDENFLDQIYALIDKENCQDVLNFIKDLTHTLLKASFLHDKKKKNSRLVEMTKLFPILIRYIDDDLPSQIECIDAIFEFSSSNSKNNNCKLLNLFDLFYENNVIPKEVFKIWKENCSPKKNEAIKRVMSFFVKLDEADISAEEFNCTSSTIKD